MRSYKAELDYFKAQKNLPTLEKVISGMPYDKAVAELKEIAEDKGYTADWLKKQLAQLNKDYHAYLTKAVEEYNAQLEKVKDQYQAVNATSFEHNFTAADYADLQFLQSLIKTRVLNECGKNPAMIERVLNDYINTQKGARAIMLLSNDKEVGEWTRQYYDTAVSNAQSPAEKRFISEKAVALDKVADEVNRMEMNYTIGASLLKQSHERVTADFVDMTNEIYWGGENNVKWDGEKAVEWGIDGKGESKNV